ncbi:MAG: dihydroorotate dehydrogenase electron transfer subunit [Anaerolineaceae bacterium]|nr:dihydroorotate dehydrogenase electron transfer subunit [Anaerolineaceae bacterium]
MREGFTTYRLASTRRLNNATLWLTFDADIAAAPGQFVMAWLPGVGEKPFSIAGMAPFSLMVVDVGPFSHALHQLTPGDKVWFKGPLGKGFLVNGKNLLLVGGGYGAAPLLALASAAREQNVKVTTCLGARSAEGLLLDEEFTQLGCQVEQMTEDGSAGRQGLVTLAVEEALARGGIDLLAACGPTGMLSALAKLAKQYHVPNQLSWEAQMRCGMGLCGSCEVPQSFDPALPPGWLACFDGPVFFNDKN